MGRHARVDGDRRAPCPPTARTSSSTPTRRGQPYRSPISSTLAATARSRTSGCSSSEDIGIAHACGIRSGRRSSPRSAACPGVVLATGQVAVAAVRVPEDERVREGRAARISRPVSKKISTFIAATTMSFTRIAWSLRSRWAAPSTAATSSPPEASLFAALTSQSDAAVAPAAPPTVRRQRRGLPGALPRRKLVELEGHRSLRRGEVGAGVAVDRLPRGEEDVGDVAEGPALPGAGVGADPGGDLEDFAAELEADAVLGVAAVDLVADPDARVDVAAAALQEEASLRGCARAPRGRAGVVRRGDLRPASHRDRMRRVPKGDGDRGYRPGRRRGSRRPRRRSDGRAPRRARRVRRGSPAGRRRSCSRPNHAQPAG